MATKGYIVGRHSPPPNKKSHSKWSESANKLFADSWPLYQPAGVTGCQLTRNHARDDPTTMLTYEFATIEQAVAWYNGPAAKELRQQLRELGTLNFTVDVHYPSREG